MSRDHAHAKFSARGLNSINSNTVHQELARRKAIPQRGCLVYEKAKVGVRILSEDVLSCLHGSLLLAICLRVDGGGCDMDKSLVSRKFFKLLIGILWSIVGDNSIRNTMCCEEFTQYSYDCTCGD